MVEQAEKVLKAGFVSEFLKSNNLDDVINKNASFKDYPVLLDREKWESISPEYKKAIISEGEKYLNHVWVSATAMQLTGFSVGDSCSLKISGKKRSDLAALVFAECIENEGRFIPDIINGVWSICEESSWVGASHYFHWRTLPDIKLPDVETFFMDLHSFI